MSTLAFACFSLLAFVEFLSRKTQPHLNWVCAGAMVRLSWVYAPIGHKNYTFALSLSPLFFFIHSKVLFVQLRCIGIYCCLILTVPLEISFAPTAGVNVPTKHPILFSYCCNCLDNRFVCLIWIELLNLTLLLFLSVFDCCCFCAFIENGTNRSAPNIFGAPPTHREYMRNFDCCLLLTQSSSTRFWSSASRVRAYVCIAPPPFRVKYWQPYLSGFLHFMNSWRQSPNQAHLSSAHSPEGIWTPLLWAVIPPPLPFLTNTDTPTITTAFTFYARICSFRATDCCTTVLMNLISFFHTFQLILILKACSVGLPLYILKKIFHCLSKNIKYKQFSSIPLT